MKKRNLKFGIELEVATRKSRIEIMNALEEHGIKVESARYGSEVNHNAWKIQPDGSIKGWEIVSPPMTNTEELEIVAYVLRKVVKAQGSPKCGLHIHHDINDLNIEQIKNIYRIYSKYENNAIRSIMRKHRYDNVYCRPVHRTIRKVEQVTTIQGMKRCFSSRYYNLNFDAYVKYGTIEFRHHHGTTDINEILTWLEITNKIIEAACNGVDGKEPLKAETYEEALEEFFAEIGLEDSKIQRLARNRRKAIEKMDNRPAQIC